MSKLLEVGKSWRTYAKHDLMNSFVGQEVGSTGKLPSIDRLVWIDLTAGDGIGGDGAEWHRSCSPGILASHAAGSRKPVAITLHEIQPATYDRLLANLDQHLPAFGYERIAEAEWLIKSNTRGAWVRLRALNSSGQTADVSAVRKTDAVLAFNDPNAITEWAMRDGFVREIAERGVWCFRSLSTMGCNAGGLKRLTLEERQGWFALIGDQQAALPGHRDLVLAAIERDEAQWAYLLCTAEKWRTSTEKVVASAFRRIGRTVAMTSFRRESTSFEEIKRVLFLTKKERATA